MLNLKKIFLLLLVTLSLTLAETQEEKVCNEAKEKFEQINYFLIKIYH